MQVNESDCRRIIEQIQELADTSSVIIMSGSVPAGGGADLYRCMIEAIKPSGVPVTLDTSGEALMLGIQAGPFMIKPNKEEIAKLAADSGLVPEADSSIEEQLVATIRHLVQSKNILCVAVSLGEQGAMVGFGDKIYTVSAAKVEAVNPVGSGDSFVAGFAAALHRGYDIIRSLQLASACGASKHNHSRIDFSLKPPGCILNP
ncbi:PfkB family carbohydrate kinase [Paenibacillus filicis]|uniref:PfkB family carbohydrate kinase n=1 Tax=Paenibacillus filicis TaxID=669464 RepID=A0ABU9DKQ7_9BACL